MPVQSRERLLKNASKVGLRAGSRGRDWRGWRVAGAGTGRPVCMSSTKKTKRFLPIQIQPMLGGSVPVSIM